MPHFLGILFAFVALISWGFGDFFIQQTIRAIGSWKSLFFIGATGFVALFPFVYDDLFVLDAMDLLLLCVLGIVVLFTTLFDFEALREGKIAVVEPVIGLELPITVGLSMTVARESLSLSQIFVIGLIFIGIMCAITTHWTHLHHRRMLEKGIILAGMGAIGMALCSFLVGISSRSISPLVTIWFSHSLLAVVCIAYLAAAKELPSLVSSMRKYPRLILSQSVLDNAAWVAFATATTFVPIAIAATISESYVALAVLLGIFVNREKLKPHQLAGILLAVAGAIALSYISS
ncbi:DMT family transporter [Candidatus Kaiserbacteria bacterium]|nr:DMT family transporter [Candidatus Kaiserbacteria bacterium]